MPDLTGRTAIVTGASSGLGLATALELGRHGAQVTLAVRDLGKGAWAAGVIREQAPRADVTPERLDLADLASVHAFADTWSAAHPEGLQFGTNHLGHFALTGLLLPALIARPRSRVVTVSSFVHRMGSLDLDYLTGSGHRHKPWTSYAQSKLANLLFTTEFQRRLDATGVPVLAMAAHPGYANTALQGVGPTMRGATLQARFMEVGNRIAAQSPEMGALPTLFAATAPGLPGDSYVGPDGFMEMRGFPRLVGRSAAARDRRMAGELWAASERLTGVVYPLDVP